MQNGDVETVRCYWEILPQLIRS